MRQLKITKQITDRESASLDKYLREVSKFKRITPDEEVVLARKIHLGDRKSFEILINSNLRFVVSVAKHYQGQGLTLPDLISEGNLGLIKAAELFDETRGFKFISYAVWWIRQSILQALSEHARIVRVPFNKISSYNRIFKAFIKLEQEYQREPTMDEIGEMIHLHPPAVDEALNPTTFHVSMDASLDDEGFENNLYDLFTINDIPGPDNSLIDDSLKQDIERIVDSLTHREEEIITDYFGLKGKQALSLEEISTKLKLTRERVRQIKMKALMKLQCVGRNRLLKSYIA